MFHTNSFSYQKSWWKVQVSVATPQELKLVCRYLNNINGDKIVLCLTTEKKNCLLLKKLFKLGVEKSLIPVAPHVSNDQPLMTRSVRFYNTKAISYPATSFKFNGCRT